MAQSSERALLAVCLRDPVCVDEAVSIGVKRDHFEHPHHRILWSQFVKDRTAGIGPDRATLYDKFEDRIGENKPFESYEEFGRLVEFVERTPGNRNNGLRWRNHSGGSEEANRESLQDGHCF